MAWAQLPVRIWQARFLAWMERTMTSSSNGRLFVVETPCIPSLLKIRLPRSHLCKSFGGTSSFSSISMPLLCMEVISASRSPNPQLQLGVSYIRSSLSSKSQDLSVTLFSDAAFFLFLFGGFGITGGAHRLWAHRCYKAKLPLRIFAAVAQTIAVQVRTCSKIKQVNIIIG